MKILFTGASSFTGYWFVKELAAAGHEIVCIFRHPADGYSEELRRKRVALVGSLSRPVTGVSFGDDGFLDLIRAERWDVFCHHAADVSNYRSPDFDVAAALANNTRRLPTVFDALEKAGCAKIILTGSVFENDEGAGSDPLEAFSPYGLSKAFTWQLFKFHTSRRKLALGKFVIPNPFGPYEEPRFTSYLMRTWQANGVAHVKTPAYVRDNIHISSLAQAYVHFLQQLPNGMSRANPSGYVESQGAFTQRVAKEMRSRLNLPCEYELAEQREFSEPPVRINIEPIKNSIGWSETKAWDDFAGFYALTVPRFGDSRTSAKIEKKG